MTLSASFGQLTFLRGDYKTMGANKLKKLAQKVGSGAHVAIGVIIKRGEARRGS